MSWSITIDHTNPPGVSIHLQNAPSQPFRPLKTGIDVHDTSTTVTIPSDSTEYLNSVLRWEWASKDDGGYYVGCADVGIQAASLSSSNDGNGIVSVGSDGTGKFGDIGATTTTVRKSVPSAVTASTTSGITSLSYGTLVFTYSKFGEGELEFIDGRYYG
jgi:hypothetical protein